MSTIDPSQRTLRGQAHTILREELVSGALSPGERINEVELANRIGVSRGTIREALRTLEQEGLIYSIAHRGVFVRKLTPQEAADVSEVRLALEVSAAWRVSRDLTDAHRKLLEASLEQLTLAVDREVPFPQRLRADHHFHETICVASGNAALLRTWRGIMGSITAMVLTVGAESMRSLHSPDAHRELLAVIEARADRQQIWTVFEKHFQDGLQVVLAAVAARHDAT